MKNREIKSIMSFVYCEGTCMGRLPTDHRGFHPVFRRVSFEFRDSTVYSGKPVRKTQLKGFIAASLP